jgi:hypothetical protein
MLVFIVGLEVTKPGCAYRCSVARRNEQYTDEANHDFSCVKPSCQKIPPPEPVYGSLANELGGRATSQTQVVVKRFTFLNLTSVYLWPTQSGKA